jgi:cytochrome b pre-mRNA-processing protein 3
MIFERLFAPGAAKRGGRKLADAAMTQGRERFLYETLGAPDTVEGRFELLTLHVILLLERLGEGEPRQALFDAYLSDLDAALREMGVGDLAVGKRMRRMGQAIYGRARAWKTALAALPDEKDARSVLARTVFAGLADQDPAGLASYVAHCHRRLAAQDAARLADGVVEWPAP